MAGYLTTHVLDTARGRPGAGMRVTLFRLRDEKAEMIREMITNADGRTDAPILPEAEFETGDYELVFAAGAYFATNGHSAGEMRAGSETTPEVFLDDIPIRFRMSTLSHYHVPLLVSPFGYTTYRGS